LATCTNITAATCVDNGLVGDTTTAPDQNKTGSISAHNILIGSGAEGTCDVSNRGRIVMVQGGAGVADTLRICSKDASNNYAFNALY
jgi:hypothetical protein